MLRKESVLVSKIDDSARARLIRTRRGTWIDESLLPDARQEFSENLRVAYEAVGEDVAKELRGNVRPALVLQALDTLLEQAPDYRLPEEEGARKLAQEARKTAAVCGCCGRELSAHEPAYFGARVYVGMQELNWRSLLPYSPLKLHVGEPDYTKTVLCGSCAPEWLSPDMDDVVTQLCAHCERLMVLRLNLSSLGRTFCSDACRQNYHNQLRNEKRAEERKKVCTVCGEGFIPDRRDAKTCSRKCKQKAYRERKKEARETQ